MSQDICEVVVTGDDPDWLFALTRTLIDERWCACAQHIVPVRSVYRWQGAIEEASEARAALHTTAELVPLLIERIRRDHPYDVACILALPVSAANPDYAAWVRAEVRPPPPPASPERA